MGNPKRRKNGLSERLTRLSARSYNAYMHSDHWHAVRRSMLNSDSVCTGCRSVTGADLLQLHHITYARLGRERRSDLLPLCQMCHEKLHAYLDELYPDTSLEFKVGRTWPALATLFGVKRVKRDRPSKEKPKKVKSRHKKAMEARASEARLKRRLLKRKAVHELRSIRERKAKVRQSLLGPELEGTLEDRVRERIRIREQAAVINTNNITADHGLVSDLPTAEAGRPRPSKHSDKGRMEKQPQ